jgi:hypothetical protein
MWNRPECGRRYKQLLPFTTLRQMARTLQYSNRAQFEALVSAYPPCPWLPRNPDEIYSEEWLGWADFLGAFRGFESALIVVKELELQDQLAWYDFAADESRLSALRLPQWPRSTYCSEWKSYDHWLGLPERTLFVSDVVKDESRGPSRRGS